MSNYEKAFDLIGISRGGGGFGLSGGATGEAPYDPYRMWVDKGNIHENSSIGVSQQLKKQGQIAAKIREEYEREQRKMWDDSHKNEKSGSFTDAEKQKRDADVKEAMKDYDASPEKQKEAYERFRPDLSSAEAANERRAAERKDEAKQQREDAALAAAHSYLEGIDDGHGEPDLSSGGTPPPKKKQSGSGDTTKVAKEALEKTASPKETSAAEIKRPVIVEPDNFEMKDGAELLTYETDGAIYAFYAYNEDEFGQVVIPTDITDLIASGFDGEYVVNVAGGKVGLSSLPTDDVGLEVVTPEDLVMYNDADVLYGTGYAFYAYDGENFGQTTIPPPSVRKWNLLLGADQSTNPGEWSAWYAPTYGLMWFDYDAASGSYNPALIGQAASGKALVSTGVNTPPAFRYLYGSDIYDISSYTGDSLPVGNQGDILYNDGSDWQSKTPFLNSVLCFEKNKTSPEPIFLYNDLIAEYNIHKYLHFSGSDATPSVDQIAVEHIITSDAGNYNEQCLLSVTEYGEITLTPYAYAGMPIYNLMDPSRSSCEILLQLDGDGKATAKQIVDPSGTLAGDYIMKMTVASGVRTFEWVTYGE